VRLLTLVTCVVVAGCSGQTLSQTSPSQAAPASTSQEARKGGLPFKGSFAGQEVDTVSPPLLLVEGTAHGNATHLGGYSASFSISVTLDTGRSTGSMTLTAANGDRLFTSVEGVGVPTSVPNVASITELATVTGGTGRFAGTTGTFTIRRILDQSTGVSSGSFEGAIDLRG